MDLLTTNDDFISCVVVSPLLFADISNTELMMATEVSSSTQTKAIIMVEIWRESILMPIFLV